jgi:hypothetical protein
VKESPLVNTIALPQSVEGEDCVVFQSRTSLVKKLFRQKSPTKFNMVGSNSRVQSVEV